MLSRFVDIRRTEVGKTALAFLILLLVVGAYTVVKAVRDAVFLSRFDVTEISLIAVGLAVLAGLLVALYLRVTAGVGRTRLISGTNALVAVSLVGLWWALRAGEPAPWVPWALYIWSNLFGVFLVMQFWLLASDLFDIREARRLFGLVGAGAIVGGLVGGLLARLLAARIGSAGLLLISAAMLVGAATLTHVVWRFRRVEPSPAVPRREVPPRSSLVAFLTTPSYARVIALGLLVTTVCTTLLDWQFKTVAKYEFASRVDQMATFFGTLSASLSAVALVLQLLVTGWLLGRYGVGVGRMIMPAFVLLGALSILGHAFLPIALLSALAAVKVGEEGLSFTVNKAATELTWLAAPAEQRERAKSLVDTVVDRLGTGLAGLLWLLLAAVGLDRPDRVHWVSLVVMGLALGWIAGLRRMQHDYLDAFRSTLAERKPDLGELRRSLGAAEARRTLLDALRAPDPGQVRFALYLLRSWPGDLPDLSPALGSHDAATQLEALHLLTARSERGQRRAALPCLLEGATEVRQAAIVYLRKTAPAGGDDVLDGLPADPQTRLVQELVRLGDPARSEAALAVIARRLAAGDRFSRRGIADLLGAAPPEAAAALLGPLLDDPHPGVVEAAWRAIRRAGAAASIPAVVRMLSDHRWRPQAVAALAGCSGEQIAKLVPQLHDPGSSVDARRAIVRLIGGSGRPELAAELIPLLGGESGDLADQALRGLARLHAHGGVRVDHDLLDALTRTETHALTRDLLFLGRGAWSLARHPPATEDLLGRALRESADTRVRRLFLVLGLRFAAADIRAAYRGLRSPVRATRSHSVEFLDNLLSNDLRSMILPALEDHDRDRFEAGAARRLGLAPESRAEVLARLLRGPQRWLRLVAAWAVGQEEMHELRPALEATRPRGEGGEAAIFDRALEALDGRNREEGSMALTVVERALKLGTIDVLRRVTSEDLAYIAQLAEDVELPDGALIYAAGDTPDALYVVLSGRVRLHQGDDEIGVIGSGEAFGSWALFDEAPRVASATASGPTTLLKVQREEFLELLADRADIAQAVFKAMVERLRTLAEMAKGS